MEEKSRYAQAILAMLAAFLLVCGTWFLARTSSPESYRVNTVQRPVADTAASEEGPEDSHPDSLLPGEVIDINAADSYDLQRLPGIGEKRAGDIIAYREEHGPFRSVEELVNVPGIGPGILEGIQEYVTAGD